MVLTTLSGEPVCRLGLASQYLEEIACFAAAFQAGMNYFFSYDLLDDVVLEALQPQLTSQRDAMLIATGSESKQLDALQTYLQQIQRSLPSSPLDAFFAEYISPSDRTNQIQATLSLLYQWKDAGYIRYVGASTHSRAIALQLIEQCCVDVLMLRYNMAHRKVEDQVLPAAQAAGIPVIAFTCTRWGQLLQGHPQWSAPVPTAADCYRYVLHHPAVAMALTAPATVTQLQENLAALQQDPMAIAEIQHWQVYGDLIYGTGQDAFETQWE